MTTVSGQKSGGLKLVLFGPPGAGKGTQAQLLRERLGIEHVASGDLFRHHLSNGTELGEMARDYMNRGALVPDEVTIGMVIDRIGQIGGGDGFMLDGFPRNTKQAQALESALGERGQGIDRVIHIRVADDELIRRLSNRYICRACQRPYARDDATGAPPKRCEYCSDGGDIYQRTTTRRKRWPTVLRCITRRRRRCWTSTGNGAFWLTSPGKAPWKPSTLRCCRHWRQATNKATVQI